MYHLDNLEDETQTLVYLRNLYNLTLNLITHSKQHTIFDVSVIIDTLFYLISAQVFLFFFFINLINF